MKPNFNNGDRILVEKNFGELNRGDLITFLFPKDRTKWYFKRVIGLPGETVEIKAGKVFINGQPLDEPYLDQDLNQQKATFPLRKIEPYRFYVLGDNRDNSSDSRYWGAVDEKLITGKYTMTYSKTQ